MRHEARRSFQGNAEKALGEARSQLVARGFRLGALDGRSFTAESPGYAGTKDDPLRAVSHVKVQALGTELVAACELGGVRRMAWFLAVFPPALVACVLGIQVALSPGLMPLDRALRVGGTIALPWLVLAPALVWWIRRRAVAAIDTILSNASLLASQD